MTVIQVNSGRSISNQINDSIHDKISQSPSFEPLGIVMELQLLRDLLDENRSVFASYVNPNSKLGKKQFIMFNGFSLLVIACSELDKGEFYIF